MGQILTGWQQFFGEDREGLGREGRAGARCGGKLAGMGAGDVRRERVTRRSSAPEASRHVSQPDVASCKAPEDRKLINRGFLKESADSAESE